MFINQAKINELTQVVSSFDTTPKPKDSEYERYAKAIASIQWLCDVALFNGSYCRSWQKADRQLVINVMTVHEREKKRYEAATFDWLGRRAPDITTKAEALKALESLLELDTQLTNYENQKDLS